MTDLGTTCFNSYLIFPSITLAISDLGVYVGGAGGVRAHAHVSILKIDGLVGGNRLRSECVSSSNPLIPAVDE